MVRRNIIFYSALALFVAALCGCIPKPKRVPADYDQRASSIRTIAILAPDIDCYRQSAGGVHEKNEADAEQARRNIVAVLATELSKRGFSVKLIPRVGKQKESLDEIQDLFYAIVWSYEKHATETRSINLFPIKAASFDYSVGSLDGVLEPAQADALFLVGGHYEGNSFFMVGTTFVAMAIAGRTGELLWYDRYIGSGRGSGRDIRTIESSGKIVRDLLDRLPEVRK